MRDTILFFFTLLGLFATRGALATPSSYQDWVNSLPSCARDCANSYFDQVMKPACGDVASSSRASDVLCICQNDQGGQSDSSKALNSCLDDKCDSNAEDLVVNKNVDYTQMCTNAYNDSKSSSSDENKTNGAFPNAAKVSIASAALVLFSIVLVF
ncbi:hypothetical protein VTN00DRAFT_2668 [Thermoascus crustaceus]|uniref:uncharacterized protein n=1 Tax=Thermoascus crustaceus TaxID=5088 RepID=UPI003743E22B